MSLVFRFVPIFSCLICVVLGLLTPIYRNRPITCNRMFENMETDELKIIPPKVFIDIIKDKEKIIKDKEKTISDRDNTIKELKLSMKKESKIYERDSKLLQQVIDDLNTKFSYADAQLAFVQNKLDSRCVIESLENSFRTCNTSYYSLSRMQLWKQVLKDNPEYLKKFTHCELRRDIIADKIIKIYNQSSSFVHNTAELYNKKNYIQIKECFPDDQVCVLQSLVAWRYPDAVEISKDVRVVMLEGQEEDVSGEDEAELIDEDMVPYD